MARLNHCFQGDNRESMRKMLADGYAGTVQCIVTSPPYWGLRDYGHDGQLGLEPTLQEFIANQVDVFELCRQLLADDGTLWLNMGDSYANDGKWGGSSGGKHVKELHGNTGIGRGKTFTGLRPKSLIGQPWRLAFALQEAGWILRQDIIWHKPNPMPESVRDRCTKAHEYLFLLTKSEKYYFDQEAILEPVSPNTHARLSQDVQNQIGSTRANGGGKTNGNMKAVGRGVGWGHGTDAEERERGRVTRKPVDQGVGHRAGPPGNPAPTRDPRKLADTGSGTKNNESMDAVLAIMPEKRNKRSVWTIATESYKEAHFATFPRDLVRPCVLAGSKPGQIVFDPYMGSGTVAQVAQELGRAWLGCELNPDYVKLQADKTRQLGLPLGAAA